MDDTDDRSQRLEALHDWAVTQLAEQGQATEGQLRLVAASDDASFRRYFRGEVGSRRFIFVDAPPDKEDNESFVAIDRRLQAAGVAVPRVYAVDYVQGFMMLADFGDRLLLPALQAADGPGQQHLYERALESLAPILTADPTGLPVYDEARLRGEMQLFPDWFITGQLALTLDSHSRELLENAMALLVSEALAQPVVFVHRDFHARNLMLLEGDELGVIDFQDAVAGPITYDLVSLLKDCYWRLPRPLVLELVDQFRVRHVPNLPPEKFLRWFDLMGFQRHLKCAGIFSRLNLRDGKPGYLKDIPLVLHYLIEVADLYRELNEFGDWLGSDIVPALKPGIEA